MIEHGDLIFTQIGSDHNIISTVTEGYHGALVNHVGIAVKNNKGLFVLEAFPPEVRITELSLFLHRSHDEFGNPRYLAARLLPEYRHMIPKAIAYGLRKRNIPYDQLYLSDHNALYCSELIVEMFAHANGGCQFFPEVPMSFRDKNTGEIIPAWIEYYQKFGMTVPDGEPGSNPGDLSKDPRLDIYLVVGNLAGYAAP